MGASDLTTDKPTAGDGEVADDGRPSAANGQVAKKRKKQKALAAVAENGHVGKVAKRKLAEPSSVRDAEVGQVEPPPAEPPESNGNGRAKASNGAVVGDDRTLELPAVEEVEPAEDVEPAPKRGRRAAKKAKVADDAEAEPKLRRRAAKRAEAARRATPAGRRAVLVATAASIAEAAAEAQNARPARFKRAGKYARRIAALVAILMLPGAVYALAVTQGPVTDLSRADATYISEQLVTADQRVRQQLVRLRPLHTSAAIARTRESQLTARSLALELDDRGGADAERLQHALKLEAAWLDAVGSVLANPRSPLRGELVARDAALRPALAALPSTDGLRRKGGSTNLRDFAKARVAAKRK